MRDEYTNTKCVFRSEDSINWDTVCEWSDRVADLLYTTVWCGVCSVATLSYLAKLYFLSIISHSEIIVNFPIRGHSGKSANHITPPYLNVGCPLFSTLKAHSWRTPRLISVFGDLAVPFHPSGSGLAGTGNEIQWYLGKKYYKVNIAM